MRPLGFGRLLSYRMLWGLAVQTHHSHLYYFVESPGPVPGWGAGSCTESVSVDLGTSLRTLFGFPFCEY